MNESGSSVDSSKLPENFDDQNDNLTGGESSTGIASGAGQRSMLSQSIISLSFRSQSSTDSYDTIFEPCSTNARRSEASQIDQPGDNLATQSSTSNKHQQKHHSGRLSSCHVSEVTQETMLLSPRQYPPLQVMDRSAAANDLDRTSSSVYTPNNTPKKWSAASTESLFSLHEGRISSILMSNRPSLAVGPETARTDDKVKEQAETDPSKSENTLPPDVTVQKSPNHIDTNVRGPDIASNPRRNSGKIQPLPTSVNKKHEKPSSCCKSLSCCSCSSKSLSCSCCCPSFKSCCSKPKCSCCCPSLSSCCSRPKCSCCKMPSCSCSCCNLKWCSNWNCCSKKTCCSVFKCCSKWSCSCTCPKIKSCCPSCKSCSNALCCWNWSCWKLLCSWNCNCSCWRNWSCSCFKGSCCKSWSCCCSKGSFCKSWSCCCSKRSCCKPWNCCLSWNCCSKKTCCSSWNCCSKGSCCKSWKC